MRKPFPKTIKNNPTKAGTLALPKRFFGDLSRYALAPVHTRFENVQWFIWDAEEPDPITGHPSVIKQFDDYQDAALFAFLAVELQAA